MAQIRGDRIIGTLCIRGHDYQDTGKSLRYIRGGGCVECLKITAKRYHLTEKGKEVTKISRRNRRDIAHKWHKQYYQQNREKILARNRNHYQNNKEKYYKRQLRRFNQDRSARYRETNKYMKIQRANNTQLAIGVRLRFLVWQAFKKYTETGKIMTSKQYGIDYEEIIEHLGSHPNTLGIKGKFHIDHIIPISFFDLTELDQVRIAFDPSNHRWLLANENRSKNAKMPSPEEVPIELVALLESHNMSLPINA